MNFEIGQRVVCINNKISGGLGLPGLVEGRTYVIRGKDHCPICNILNVDVGETGVDTTYCNNCHWDYYHGSGIHWYMARRFAPIEYDSAHDEIIEKFKSPKESPDIPVKEPEKVKP